MALSKKRDRKKVDRQTQAKPTGLQDVSNPDKLAALRKMPKVLDPAPRIDDVYIEAANRMDDTVYLERPPLIMPEPDSGQSTTTKTPVFNSKKHHEGDVVRKWSNGKWIEVTDPALDSEYPRRLNRERKILLPKKLRA